MTQHVDEIEDHHIQVVLAELVELLHHLVGLDGGVHFVIAEGVLLPVTFQLRLDQWLFVQVLAFFLVLVHPEVRKHLHDFIGHQT